MQVLKPLDKKSRPVKYSSDPALKKDLKLQTDDRKVEFKQTFLNPC